ncbi:MAG: TusE/DsrC/DsvC family sulfur relay protein [Congregibacter sp.]|nr:TusE/DsrC/DsvC family sulfur relay protein [Congregibacter sp.]
MVNPALPALTSEGFLVCHSDWSPGVAEKLAQTEGLSLSAAHWEVIHLLRDYYARYDSSPAMRALVKCCKLQLGDEKGRSIYLLKLFPGSPAKIASKIAGLPKPANCL